MATEWDSDWWEPRGRLAQACLADARCLLGFEAVARRAADAMEAADLDAELDAVDALVRPELATDPRWECTLEEHDTEVEWLRGWIAGASAVQRARWAASP